MNRRIVAAILIIIITLGTSLGFAQSVTYEGNHEYIWLYNNTKFKDIERNWAKDSIIRGSSLGIIRGSGSGRFNPDSTLTWDEAITLLVRLDGLESLGQATAQQTTNNVDTGGIQILFSTDYWAKGYIDTALNNNIVTQAEVDSITNISEATEDSIEKQVSRQVGNYQENKELTDKQLKNIEAQLKDQLNRKYTWKKSATREQVAIWLSRILSLEPIYGEKQQLVYTLKDWRKIKPENIPLIEAMLQDGIIKGYSDGYFKPDKTLTRGEMATMIDRILHRVLIERGYTIFDGTVYEVERVITSQSGDALNSFIDIENTEIRLKTDDYTFVNLLCQRSDDSRYNKGFLAYRNGNLGTQDRIRKGDYIRVYVNEANQAVFAEIH